MSVGLSVIIPCFDEGARVDLCLEALAGWRRAHPARVVEVLVVDDGSRDDTRARAEAAARRDPSVRVIGSDTNEGKGAALRRGMAAAHGRHVVFMDADLSVGVDQLDRALACLESGADVAVGCRNIPGAVVSRPQGVVRRTLGRGYRVLARALLGLDTPDVTCGFKGFQRDAGRELFARSRCRRFGFDAEILGLAKRAGFRADPFPVTWIDSGRSSVRLVVDLPRALLELVATRAHVARAGTAKRSPALDPSAAPTE